MGAQVFVFLKIFRAANIFQKSYSLHEKKKKHYCCRKSWSSNCSMSSEIEMNTSAMQASIGWERVVTCVCCLMDTKIAALFAGAKPLLKCSMFNACSSTLEAHLAHIFELAERIGDFSVA